MTGTVREVARRPRARRHRRRAGRQPDHPQRRGRARRSRRPRRRRGPPAPRLQSGHAHPPPGADPAQGRRRATCTPASPSPRATIAADPELDCGPSTVRNELALLEEHGLLAHPHVSAGRVPTDAGHRYVVDRLLQLRAGAARAAPRARAVADPPRGRRGDARDDRDALAGHEPAGGRLRAVDQHRDDPPRRGARAAAAGRDGRDHHLDRRRLEDARHVRARRRPGAASPGPASTSTSGSSGSASARACCTQRLADPSLSRDRARLPRALRARPSASSPREGEDALYVDGHRAPVRGGPDRGRRPGQRADRACSSAASRCCGCCARRSASRASTCASATRTSCPRCTRSRSSRPATGWPRRKLGTVSVIGPVRMDYAGAIATVREAAQRALALRRRRLRRELAARCHATPTRCSASGATPPSRRSRKPSASSRASCTRTSTPTTRRPRRSSRRPPRPTRSSPTPSAARPTTATATRACARAATRPTSTASARSATSSTPSSAAARRRRRRRRRQGGDVAVARRDRPARGRAAASTVEVAYEAVDRCERCHGNGAEPGTPIETCERCGGAGQLQAVSRTPFGQMVRTIVCDVCHGDGRVPEQPCQRVPRPRARARRARARGRVPAGIADGQRIRVGGRGHAGEAGAPAGDLYVLVSVARGRALRARRRRPDHRARRARAARRARRDARGADARGHGRVELPAGHAAGRGADAARRGHAERCAAAAAATCASSSTSSIPRRLSDEQRELLEQLNDEPDRGEPALAGVDVRQAAARAGSQAA